MKEITSLLATAFATSLATGIVVHLGDMPRAAPGAPPALAQAVDSAAGARPDPGTEHDPADPPVCIMPESPPAAGLARIPTPAPKARPPATAETCQGTMPATAPS